MIGTNRAVPANATARFSASSLVVARVTGTHPRVWAMLNGDVMVQPDTFRNALVESLRRSGLFGAVSTAGRGRFILQADIRRQDKTKAGVTVQIHYALLDRLACVRLQHST